MARKRKSSILIDDQSKGDMTPMIDIVFLLLIFFLLTTKFEVPEKAISQLLPTNKGTGKSQTTILVPDDLNIRIYPEGFSRGMGVEQMDTMWHASENSAVAMLQVGKNPPLRLESDGISSSSKFEDLDPELSKIYNHIYSYLEAAEIAGNTRDEQRPVVIHCFSALSWKYAMVAYDAVRQYEQNTYQKDIKFSNDLRAEREVSFAPPRIRNYTTWELGNDLHEILHMP